MSIHKIIEFDNFKLSYVIRSGDGSTLVLIPGSFSDANQWNEVIPTLGKNPNLILFEVRGHGKSWPQRVRGVISIGEWTHWKTSRDA